MQSRFKRLEGVDLSRKMIEIAESKKIYNQLIKKDLVEYLAEAELAFNYFVATDVLIYIGDLSEIFRLIRYRNKIGGSLAFSLEHREGEGFFLETSGRYSHSKKYIEDLCEEYGYELRHFQTAPLRKERNGFIEGGLYLLSFSKNKNLRNE